MKREGGKGLVLYEQVLQKNFQIIETFLNKFPVIFKKQDYFEESIKKINDKLLKYDQETDKIREELNLTATVLDKKIVHLKENSARNSRSSTRMSPEGSMDERKNSIFRVSVNHRDSRDQAALFSKEKMELLNEMDKKQQESNKKIEELESTIYEMQEKLNFISIMNSKLDQGIDKLIDSKVDKASFDKLEVEYEHMFQTAIGTLAEEKYLQGQKLLQDRMGQLQNRFKQQFSKQISVVRGDLFHELQKKAGAGEVRSQLKEIKGIIERMVEQSVDSFASKEETKMVLTLFQKKFSRLQLVLQQMFQKALHSSEQQASQGAMIGFQHQRQGLMNSFGRKRRVNDK